MRTNHKGSCQGITLLVIFLSLGTTNSARASLTGVMEQGAVAVDSAKRAYKVHQAAVSIERLNDIAFNPDATALDKVESAADAFSWLAYFQDFPGTSALLRGTHAAIQVFRNPPQSAADLLKREHRTSLLTLVHAGACVVSLASGPSSATLSPATLVSMANLGLTINGILSLGSVALDYAQSKYYGKPLVAEGDLQKPPRQISASSAQFLDRLEPSSIECSYRGKKYWAKGSQSENYLGYGTWMKNAGQGQVVFGVADPEEVVGACQKTIQEATGAKTVSLKEIQFAARTSSLTSAYPLVGNKGCERPPGLDLCTFRDMTNFVVQEKASPAPRNKNRKKSRKRNGNNDNSNNI